MTPNCELTRESAGAARLCRMAPWLILLAIAALMMVPGILFELGKRPAGDAGRIATLPVTTDGTIATEARTAVKPEIPSE